MIVRNLSKLLPCAMIPLGLFATPAAAQTQPETLEPVSEWMESSQPDRCRITREFGEGDNLTTLTLEKGLGRSNYNLVITSSKVGNPYSPWIRLQFGPDEKMQYRKFVASQTDDGRPVATIHGAIFAPPLENEPGVFTPDRAGPERLAKIETLAVRLVAGPLLMIRTGPMDQPAASLRQCMNSHRKQFEAWHENVLSHPEPVASPGTWFSSDDYPRELLWREEDALVEFSLVVDDQGTPNFCEIKPSGRDQRFDDAICSKLLERARFSPALDKDGKPRPDVWSSRIRFTIRK